mmetsp:Transcript_33778/g.75507  ORF Transcript_33778/g.75507 Transcript_33778/m.75507 type:complete len:218 (+) Transcript_33778:439-1092(+)
MPAAPHEEAGPTITSRNTGPYHSDSSDALSALTSRPCHSAVRNQPPGLTLACSCSRQQGQIRCWMFVADKAQPPHHRAVVGLDLAATSMPAESSDFPTAAQRQWHHAKHCFSVETTGATSPEAMPLCKSRTTDHQPHFQDNGNQIIDARVVALSHLHPLASRQHHSDSSDTLSAVASHRCHRAIRTTRLEVGVLVFKTTGPDSLLDVCRRQGSASTS